METGVPIGRYVKQHETKATARYVRIGDVAVYTSLSVRHLHDLTRTGRIPHVRVGRVVVYDLVAVDAWMAGLVAEADARSGGARRGPSATSLLLARKARTR